MTENDNLDGFKTGLREPALHLQASTSHKTQQVKSLRSIKVKRQNDLWIGS